MLGGDSWTSVAIALRLENVTLDLLHRHASDVARQESLARVDFLASRLTFESFSDGTKDIDLVSLRICVYDTRYAGAPVNVKPNVFEKILHQASQQRSANALQLELHYRSKPIGSRFTVLFNNVRVIGVFDWILAVKEYIVSPVEDPWKERDLARDGDVTPHLITASTPRFNHVIFISFQRRPVTADKIY